MGESDADVIRRWRRGDAASFAALVRRWEGPLARFLSRLAPVDDVPDLVQEVFLRVHRATTTYRENGHFSTWLFQIALNVGRGAARRARPSHPLPGGDIADERPLELEDRELGALIAKAVAELPQELREVIALRHDSGLSFEEMARRLGVPSTTLKSRFTVAVFRLRGRLRDWGYAPEGDA